MEDKLQEFDYPIQSFFERFGVWKIEEVGKEPIDEEPESDIRIVEKSSDMGSSVRSLNEDLETASESDVDSDSEFENEIIPVADQVDPDHLLNTDLLDKIFYQRKGEIDGDSWIFLALHRDGYYVFFDYTEISRKKSTTAGGLLLYTKDAKDMYNFGFDSWTRDLIPDFLKQVELD